MSDDFFDTARFVPDKAKTIATDLFSETFGSSRNIRSKEYKRGFRAGAFNALLNSEYVQLYSKPAYTVGSCQRDAWLSGYDEGKLAACSFQINFIESQQVEESLYKEYLKDGSDKGITELSFN